MLGLQTATGQIRARLISRINARATDKPNAYIKRMFGLQTDQMHVRFADTSDVCYVYRQVKSILGGEFNMNI